MENNQIINNVEPIHIEPEQPAKKRRLFKNLGKNTVRFIIKHRLFFILLLIAILINFLLFVFVPVIDAGKTKFVSLDSSVKLEINQTVKLKFSGVSFVIKGFNSDSCPSDQKCYGNGQQSVEYEMNIDGKKYATGSVIKALNTDYQIETESTDYNTYATVKIIRTPVKK